MTDTHSPRLTFQMSNEKFASINKNYALRANAAGIAIEQLPETGNGNVRSFLRGVVTLFLLGGMYWAAFNVVMPGLS